MPGVFGGVGDLVYSYTGGRQDHRCQSFDLRPMLEVRGLLISIFLPNSTSYRANGAGELYTYIPLTPQNTTQLLAAPPSPRANADYGFSVGRGTFHLALALAFGRWVALAFRVKMNDHGKDNDRKDNGEVQVWVDGRRHRPECVCDVADTKIKEMHFQTFLSDTVSVSTLRTRRPHN